ncbi:MAG: bifunctional aspartate kinase/homoserine dehydrogenase I [Bacteroidales bacterium]|nr:bifunctional aspartate kinase/homoserine dehydrogenase I [Bacteroidales bacterium]
MKVLKFGGSSVGTAERMKGVRDIVLKQPKPVLVVVSALQGITDQFEQLCQLASKHDEMYKNIIEEIRRRHTDHCAELISENKLTSVLTTVNSYIDELENIVKGIYLLEDITQKAHDRVAGYGELISSYILSSVLENAVFIDSRNLIRTDSNYGNAAVDFTVTNKQILKSIDPKTNKIYVAPGFIASDHDGFTTTLGRGGSDYSAAIYAAALDAEKLEIWTDVDGFMTADPRKVPKAFAIDALSYAEAMELSHFGAKVIYTPTIQPVYHKGIEIEVKNTFHPDKPGTVISDAPSTAGLALIKGVSSMDEIDLVTIQGPGMVGVKGISSRLFGALADNNINIILITQASSEYSISFAINPADTVNAIRAIVKEFEVEIQLRDAIKILVEKDLSIIAIVGERMKNTPGISATMFSALGRNGISVIATAQGSSELNISVVIKKASLRKALNVIHEGFFLSHYKELHLYVAGVGTVGGSLLRQIEKQQQKLLEQHRLKVNVVGITRSKKMILDPEGIDLGNYSALLEKGEPANIDKFIRSIREQNLRNSVFIDCTADEELAGKYMDVLNSYASIVTANKVAASSEYKRYSELKEAAKSKNVKFMFETNVGAGLPVISTINDLIRSGDRILKLEAVLSGTLNFIFNELSAEIPLSKAIQQAKEKGFSEPDPRIDLSGIDVIRKLLILAREAGYPLERADVDLHSFLPEECFKGTIDDFWKKVAKYDRQFEEKRKELVQKNMRWRFVASLEGCKGEVGLKEVSIDHPAYELVGSNNIILITTERYEEPMVIKGYGAGAEVTAAGVFADMIRIANL